MISSGSGISLSQGFCAKSNENWAMVARGSENNAEINSRSKKRMVNKFERENCHERLKFKIIGGSTVKTPYSSTWGDCGCANVTALEAALHTPSLFVA